MLPRASSPLVWRGPRKFVSPVLFVGILSGFVFPSFVAREKGGKGFERISLFVGKPQQRGRRDSFVGCPNLGLNLVSRVLCACSYLFLLGVVVFHVACGTGC